MLECHSVLRIRIDFGGWQSGSSDLRAVAGAFLQAASARHSVLRTPMPEAAQCALWLHTVLPEESSKRRHNSPDPYSLEPLLLLFALAFFSAATCFSSWSCLRM